MSIGPIEIVIVILICVLLIAPVILLGALIALLMHSRSKANKNAD
jgi:hypothetical protein